MCFQIFIWFSCIFGLKWDQFNCHKGTGWTAGAAGCTSGIAGCVGGSGGYIGGAGSTAGGAAGGGFSARGPSSAIFICFIWE